MESKKINQLATNLAPVSTDLTVLGDPTTGELKKITLLQIASLFGGITSIGMVVPSGFSVSPATLTANGTFTITGAGTTAQYIRGDGSLATFPTLLSSDSLIQEVRNNSGSTMLKGTIVYINGAVGNKATIAKALATTNALSSQTYGVVQDDIPNNSNGYVVVVGEVTGLNTSALTDGQQLYLSGTVAGFYTTTKPYAPIHLVYVAIVLRSHPTLGVLGVKIQNGYEMDELHNVSAQSPANNDGLFYNSTTSLWSKNTIAGVLGYTPVSSNIYTADGTIATALRTVTMGASHLLFSGATNSSGTFYQISSTQTSVNTTDTGDISLGVAYTLSASSASNQLVTRSFSFSAVNSLTGGGAITNFRILDIGVQTSAGTTATDNDIIYILGNALASGTVTNQRGVLVRGMQGTNRAAFVGDAIGGSASTYLLIGTRTIPTGTWGVYQSESSFNNYFNGKVLIGSTTDTGQKLQVTGTSSFKGTTATDGGQLGSELTTTGSGTNWAGTGFATGYTHTTGSVVALTTSLAAGNGNFYKITYTITGRTAGSVVINYGGYISGGITSTGTISPRATATTSLSITPTTDFDGTLVLSILQITGGTASIVLKNSSGTTTNEIRSASLTNLFQGNLSGAFLSTGVSNTAFGYEALGGITSGSNNVAIGYRALTINTIGDRNIAIGNSTLLVNTSGVNNVAIGDSALNGNTTGQFNTALGFECLKVNTTAGFNVGIGRQALVANTTGGINIAIGNLALSRNTTASNNTGIGGQSLYANTTGAENVSIGTHALLNNISGSNNTALGNLSGKAISGGSVANTITNNSIYIGYDTRALADNQTNQIVIGYQETGLGTNTTIIGNSSTVTTAIRGRLLLGTTTDSGLYQLDVNGTARVQDSLFVGKNENNPIGIFVSNTTSGTLSSVSIKATSSNGSMEIGKFSASTGTTKIINSSDGYIYNATAGDIAILNNFSTGKIKFAAGGSSTAQMTLSASGVLSIGTTSPNASAITQIDSTTQGFLPPRMTTTQKTAIATPAAGLVVYDTTLNKLCVYTTAWETITSL